MQKPSRKSNSLVFFLPTYYSSKRSDNEDSEVEEYIAIKRGKSSRISTPTESVSSSPRPSSPARLYLATPPQAVPSKRYSKNSCDICTNRRLSVGHEFPSNPELNEAHNQSITEGQNSHEFSYTLVPMLRNQQPSIVLTELVNSSRSGEQMVKWKRGSRDSNFNGLAATSNVTINSLTPSETGAKSYQAKLAKERNRRQGNDAVSAALSATYCKLLVLLGVCLPITEVISDQIPTYIYQGFYVYLYILSIMFVLSLYTSAFRNRTLLNALKHYQEKGGGILLKHKVTHFGSFYLRVGAIAFAIGTMVYSGLEFGQFFELNGQPGCHDIFVAITPISRMVLCIAQVQFIFLNTTYLDMARHKVLSRFGLMHMVATNLCEWLYVLVEETKHEIFHIGHPDEMPFSGNYPQNYSAAKLHDDEPLSAQQHNVSSDATHGCSRTTIMGALVQKLSPFLFPCTIEYSLICAVILYEMWKTVKSIPNINRTRRNSIKPVYQKPAHHFSVDCSQSHKGLFFGILVIVMTIIAMIMYFVLYTQPGYEVIATQEVTLWESIMYLLCSGAVITGMIIMRDLRYSKGAGAEHQSMQLDNLLLIVAQTGVYLYALFSLFGSYFATGLTITERIESILVEVFGLLQTSLQTMFILHASHRRCKGSKQIRRKPGREIITFMLIANIAIWLVNTLIKGRAVFRETHMKFFGIWAWTIITHVSMPLAIFYRFHSTICLFEVWKITYKAKAQ